MYWHRNIIRGISGYIKRHLGGRTYEVKTIKGPYRTSFLQTYIVEKPDGQKEFVLRTFQHEMTIDVALDENGAIQLLEAISSYRKQLTEKTNP